MTSLPPIARQLELEPHPEGGYYRRVFTSDVSLTGDAALSVIDYLLEGRQFSRWHVVSRDEIWMFQDGDPVELLTYDPGTRSLSAVILGSDSFHHVVPAGTWQAARAGEDWGLCACAVAPAFSFDAFRFVKDLAGHETHFTGPLQPYSSLL